MPHKVAIIITSVRTPRIGPQVASLVHTLLQNELGSDTSTTLSIVDLAPFKLPIYDEPVVPSSVPKHASFAHEHSKRWSAEIASYDAYILVNPEYNYGMAGSTKNAIDYLKNEWADKPVAIVSYGIFGGKNASEQVKTALEGMGLRVAKTRPQLVFSGGVGPEVFAAVGEGKLGENSKKDWESGENAKDIVQAFKEIQEALANPVEKKDA